MYPEATVSDEVPLLISYFGPFMQKEVPRRMPLMLNALQQQFLEAPRPQEAEQL